MQYSSGKHCVFYRHYHIVLSTKYRFKVLQGRLRVRVRDICRQVFAKNGVEIIKGVLSTDHVHMSVSTTNGATIEDIVLQYLEQHIANPTDASRWSFSARHKYVRTAIRMWDMIQPDLVIL